MRTQLAWAAYLGTEVLPEPAAVVAAVRGALECTAPGRRKPTVHGSYRDLTDGFDSRLAACTVVVG